MSVFFCDDNIIFVKKKTERNENLFEKTSKLVNKKNVRTKSKHATIFTLLSPMFRTLFLKHNVKFSCLTWFSHPSIRIYSLDKKNTNWVWKNKQWDLNLNTPPSWLSYLLCLELGQWQAWGEFTSCSQTCGGGEQSRQRKCSHDDSSVRLLKCESAMNNTKVEKETKKCNEQPCNGEWIKLGVWNWTLLRNLFAAMVMDYRKGNFTPRVHRFYFPASSSFKTCNGGNWLLPCSFRYLVIDKGTS